MRRDLFFRVYLPAIALSVATCLLLLDTGYSPVFYTLLGLNMGNLMHGLIDHFKEAK